MQVFETILLLLLGATVLSAFARRVNIPYPTLLALGGMVIAFVPGSPRLDLPPDLILALFVAPVLLDAAYDSSLRDLRTLWLPVASLVLVAVTLTTVAVAVVVHQLLPGIPWAAAIALGALVAPPDAVAALAVLRAVNPPYRLRMVLEGESLVNDATALLIYKLAVGAVAAGAFHFTTAIPTFALVAFGSVFAGWLLSYPLGWLSNAVEDAPSAVTLQFVTTFAVWILAERLGLSGVVTIVVFGLSVAQRTTAQSPARLRLASFAIWESATKVLNVLAFTLIGLQIGPIFESLSPAQRLTYLSLAFVVLAVVMVVRMGWVMTHYTLLEVWNRLFTPAAPPSAMSRPTARGAVVVGWSGMRGIVTLAAAMALPTDFPYRDFIQLTAFVVVLGTLVLQGLTLRPLLLLLRIPPDNMIEREIGVARRAAIQAALEALGSDPAPAAQRLQGEYAEALALAHADRDPHEIPDHQLRRALVEASRRATQFTDGAGTIGDDAYRRVEEELDRLELSASG